jgi:hypothetical protein
MPLGAPRIAQVALGAREASDPAAGACAAYRPVSRAGAGLAAPSRSPWRWAMSAWEAARISWTAASSAPSRPIRAAWRCKAFWTLCSPFPKAPPLRQADYPTELPSGARARELHKKVQDILKGAPTGT